MIMRSFRPYLAVLLWLPVLTARAANPDLVLAFRDASGSYVVTAIGDMYIVRDKGIASKLFTLSEPNGKPFRWHSTPSGIARWGSEWLVCDNSTRLLHFDSRGRFIRATELPVRAAGLTIAGGNLVIHNLIAGSPAEQLWMTRDGTTFVPLALQTTQKFESPLDNLLIIAGNPRGEIWAAPVIGPPVITQLWPTSRVIQSAYSRTKFRAGLDQPIGFVDDIGPYSQPVRDLYPLADGGIVALRNREDIRHPDGRQETVTGRHVDRYDATGKQNATAEFGQTMRWVTLVTDRTVTAVTRTGEAVTVPWGKPDFGQILKPPQ